MNNIWALARRYRIMLIAGAAVLAMLFAFNFMGSEAPEDEPDLAMVTRGDIENVVPSAGSLQPLNFVDVGAQVSGQLQTLHAEAGDHVEQGELLAEIDATVQMAKVASIRAQLQRLQAQMQDRQAQLQLSRIQSERQQRLMDDNATSQQDYDSAEATLASANAQLHSTEAEIVQTRSELQGEEALLGYSKIYAPISGTVSSIVAREGQTLNANQSAPAILQIADLSKMTVSTQVSEADVSKLHIGMEAYFTTLGGGNQRWSGHLRQVLPTPEVLNNVVLYTALFDVDNPGGELMTQMTAQVYFVVAAAYDVLRVPVGAVRFEGRGGSAGRDNGTAGRGSPQPGLDRAEGPGRPAIVMVLSDGGDFVQRDVRIGVSDRIYAEVLSGLEEGDEVAILAAAGPQRNNGNNNEDRWMRRFGTPMGGLP
nr:MAG: efflux RND transporter periplasmic adaptor subunit [Hyphomicrobiales bacterium]